MQSLARNGYSAEAVKKALHAPKRSWRFKYEVYDKTGTLKRRASSVIACTVRLSALDDIKRTARFSLKDVNEISFLSDRIKPYACLRMPDNGYVEFPQGVFVLATTPRKSDASGVVTVEVDGYDLGIVVRDDKVTNRYSVAAGDAYITKVSELLTSAGITAQNLVASPKTLPAAREWEPGTSKSEIINDLLQAINYAALWFDENGVAVAAPYVSPSSRSADYVYNETLGVTLPEAEVNLDAFSVPNQWVLVVSSPDVPTMRSEYTNASPNSPTSTVNRGRTIPIVETVEAATQADLDARVRRRAEEASQVYEHVTFSTLIMPFHGHFDVLSFQSSALNVNALYSEVSWEFELRANATMSHEVRRIVQV